MVPSCTPTTSSYYRGLPQPDACLQLCLPCQLLASAHCEAWCLPAHTGHSPPQMVASQGRPSSPRPSSCLSPSPQPALHVGQGRLEKGAYSEPVGPLGEFLKYSFIPPTSLVHPEATVFKFTIRRGGREVTDSLPTKQRSAPFYSQRAALAMRRGRRGAAPTLF